MNGLKYSREYFERVAQPSLKQGFPELYGRLAAGLVGNGSECFGFDDLISRDHDWGADFYIWTQEQDRDIIPALIDWKSVLLEKNPPGYARTRSDYGARIGVMTCGDFYYSLTGSRRRPETLNEWLRAPEEQFALAVNGEVFFDAAGEFTAVRNGLLDFYPEDIRLKKIAARCMALSQTGQYNHIRTAKRGDTVTLRIVLSRLTDSAIAMVFLLNKTYRPYYKWAYRAMKGLPLLGGQVASLLYEIAETYGLDDKSLYKRQKCIDDMCALIVDELNLQAMSDSDDDYLASHGELVQRKIKDATLRSLPPQYVI